MHLGALFYEVWIFLVFNSFLGTLIVLFIFNVQSKNTFVVGRCIIEKLESKNIRNSMHRSDKTILKLLGENSFYDISCNTGST